MSLPIDRRSFLGAAATATLGMALPTVAMPQPDEPARRKGAKSVMGLAHAPMSTIRFAVIGVGARGSGHVNDLLLLDGVEVVAIGDLYKDLAENAAKSCVAKGRKAPELYTDGPENFMALVRRDDVDAVIIATPWEDHARMAVAAMKAGKHVFIEVPAVVTLEECWEIVDVAEQTQRHCMMLENVCYGAEELAVLNMCRSGVFGELLHGEAAYIHDLRGQMHEVERGTGSWRTGHYMRRNGNLYPTHGLGPIAQYMGINRGDRFGYLTSVSSPPRVRQQYAKDNFPADHKWNTGHFLAGDINTTLVKTARGRTIMIQWDEQLPRPYSRLNFIQGTKGAWGGFPARCVVEGRSKDAGSWDTGSELKAWTERYEHPLWAKMGEAAKAAGGHGGMDFMMLWRLVVCLREGLPLDQDVYDAASWSSIAPLSERSVGSRGTSVDVPDFTRGAWKEAKPLDIVN